MCIFIIVFIRQNVSAPRSVYVESFPRIDLSTFDSGFGGKAFLLNPASRVTNGCCALQSSYFLKRIAFKVFNARMFSSFHLIQDFVWNWLTKCLSRVEKWIRKSVVMTILRLCWLRKIFGCKMRYVIMFYFVKLMQDYFYSCSVYYLPYSHTIFHLQYQPTFTNNFNKWKKIIELTNFNLSWP